MHIIMGGTGQVGSSVARALLDANQEVTVVTRDEGHASSLKGAGARIAVTDLRDVDALRKIFRTGPRAFLLNPPANPSTDIDAEDRGNVAAMIAALEGSGLEKVVAQSTYGAFEGECCADLTALHELERGLLHCEIPTPKNRGGYYMSNWANMIGHVRENGTLLKLFSRRSGSAHGLPQRSREAAARRLM